MLPTILLHDQIWNSGCENGIERTSVLSTLQIVVSSISLSHDAYSPNGSVKVPTISDK